MDTGPPRTGLQARSAPGLGGERLGQGIERPRQRPGGLQRGPGASGRRPGRTLRQPLQGQAQAPGRALDTVGESAASASCSWRTSRASSASWRAVSPSPRKRAATSGSWCASSIT